MADALFFRILFVALYALFFGVRGYFRFVRPLRTEPDHVDERKKFGIAEGVMSFAILAYFGSIIPYLIGFEWMAWSQIPFYPDFLRWLGVGLALLSVPLLGWIHLILDRQYSPCLQIKESHSLITEGPYKRVRHPMYTVLNMFSFGISLLTANFLIIGFATLVLIPFPFVAKKEEQMLLETFGEEYEKYMKQTGRFFPKFS